MANLSAYALWQDTLDLVNVEQRGQLTVDRFNRFANTAIKWFIEYLTGNLSEMPQPRLELGKFQKPTDYLKPLLRFAALPFLGSLIPYPDDYRYLADLRISGGQYSELFCDKPFQYSIDQIMSGAMGFRQVDVLSHDKIPSRANSHIKLLKEKPSAEQYNEGFRLYPYTQSGSAFIAYVAEPPAMKLAMKLDPATNSLVYDPLNTIDPLLDEKAGPFVARKVAQLFFLWTREGDAIQITDMLGKTE